MLQFLYRNKGNGTFEENGAPAGREAGRHARAVGRAAWCALQRGILSPSDKAE